MCNKRSIAIILAIVMLFSMSAIAVAEGAANLGQVTTKYGIVEGVQGEAFANITLFKGVPYAAPPVGELRWVEPKDVIPWEGVLKCDTYADAAVQPPYALAQFTDPTYIANFPDGIPSNSEDCLYLNIATPAVEGGEKLPVIIYFHGGALAHGFSYQDNFDMEGLANNGCIVVTVGTRLNILGYLSLPQLTAESSYGGSGNYGAMDCAKAVEWVYENIEAFGGDASRIIVSGQSGGSWKVTTALMSPKTEGMIAGSINQSFMWPFNTYKTLEENEAAGLAFLEALGMDENSTLEELRAIPAEKLEEAYNSFSCSICIDGYSIIESAKDFYTGAGNLDNFTIMTGNVLGESGTLKGESADDLYAKIREKYGDDLYEKYDIGNTLVITQSNYKWYNYLLANHAALAEARLFAAIAEKANTDFNIYIYSFDHVMPDRTVGTHSGELWYTFNSLRSDVETQPEWTVWDFIVGDIASGYWCSYAEDCDPNAAGMDAWPVANAENNYAIQYIDYNSSTYDELSSFDRMVMDFVAEKYQIDLEQYDLSF